ncbi:hypothetical protein C8P68_101312 [Mucilaginibacter yixingensis]|uniref:Uncharacterized protein n=1 Tax=Mucilaginibacter yixingensis TaxID=1295612 RepID=A0A2T5JF78_9SPHI|nr:hypothetical protein [Mucilaginibacter yixingensis]PTR01081.1 hypothetical protein C8P68_101312 [Mucilaginibacter yixingensis]
MEKINITIAADKVVYSFEVADYPHHQHNHCKFEIFQDGKLVAGFDPDAQHILHICNNKGHLSEDVLHLLAHEIERFHW